MLRINAFHFAYPFRTRVEHQSSLGCKSQLSMRRIHRRWYNSSRDGQAASTSRREGESGRTGGRYSSKTDETLRYRGTSRYSQYDTGRNIQRAPWEQGPDRTARINHRDTRPPIPVDRVWEDVEEDSYGEELDRDNTPNKDARTSAKDSENRGELSAMARIVEKLRSIQNNKPARGPELEFKRNRPATETSVFLPRPGHPVHPGLDRRWSNPDHPVPKRSSNDPWQLQGDAIFPWDKVETDNDENEEEQQQFEKKKRVRPPSLAELTLPEDELKRLRGLGLMVRQRLKIGRVGVTPGIVEAIHNAWRTCEIAKVKCDGPPALNMRKTHDDLERLTGGLVIWRAGSAAVLYRGKDYVPPSERQLQEREEAEKESASSLGLVQEDESEVKDGDKINSEGNDLAESALLDDSGTEVENIAKVKEQQELNMMEEILEGLGPRYADWTGMKPVPVDGDLLLSEDATFKRPFRLLPYGVKPKLNNFELTELRHLARPIPPHFVLGRNRGLGGLAAAIVKLWEKSEIVKIGVKRGVQNTNNERMAEELKKLTGGLLLARDKEFIVLFRGKDFLPPAVQKALEERDQMARALQEEEERVRMSRRSKAVHFADMPPEPSKVGTLAEALEAKATWESWQNSDEVRQERIAARKAARALATRRIENKVILAGQKKERAERELAKLDAQMRPAGAPVDKEHLSEEERYMFRKLGLRMKAFLLLGRRGIFDGTVENMHLHWKHRQLVKIIVKGTMAEAEQTARMLEIESGGLLVGIVTTSKGNSIIIYRGKNYERPPELRPRHLLTKRQALKRSLEMQRKESLEKHIAKLEKEIEKMKIGLNNLENEDRDFDSGGIAEASADLQNDFEVLDNVEFELDADYNYDDRPLYRGEKRVAKPDPIFIAEPLTRKERAFLRQQAMKLSKAAHFNVGKSNVEEGLSRGIREYLKKHPLVKIGVKGRAKGSSVADIVQELEEATGAVLVSTEPSKLIFYRGWPAGEERPDMTTDKEEEVDSPDIRATTSGEEIQGSMDASYPTQEASSLGETNVKENLEEESEDENGLVDEDDMGIDAWNEEEWDEEEEVNEDESEWVASDSDSEHEEIESKDFNNEEMRLSV